MKVYNLSLNLDKEGRRREKFILVVCIKLRPCSATHRKKYYPFVCICRFLAPRIFRD